MAYLKDFLERIAQNDYLGFLRIWEEYCYSDEIDAAEFIAILEHVKNSVLAASFGKNIEKGIHLLEKISEPAQYEAAISLFLDLQNTNSERFYELAINFLRSRFPNDPMFEEKCKLVGLRGGDFQGAVRNYILLSHLQPGNFVYHTAGWGTSEIIDISFVREEVSLECDLVLGQKHLSLRNAFNTLIPLPKDHFLARRFGNPDALEAEAKKNPTMLIRMLLRDLGPKTAADIKNELLELVIPEKDWNKWWQQARTKIKKDTKIEMPSSTKGAFHLLEEELPHEVAFYKSLESEKNIDETIQMVYSFLRDFPETLKNQEFRQSLSEKFDKVLADESIETPQRLQLLFFKEDLQQSKKSLPETVSIIQNINDVEQFIKNIQILSLKKRTFALIKELRKDWKEIFLHQIFIVDQNLLRDFLFTHLNKADHSILTSKLQDLILHPTHYPEFYVWYFQKVITSNKSEYPFSNKEGKCELFEGFLTLLAHLSGKMEMRELSKKMVTLITADRYKLVRMIMDIATPEDLKEYMLLSTKCAHLTDHDIKIIHSLAEVVHPSLAKEKKEELPEEVIQTTQEGYDFAKNRLETIANKELIETAREIEEARSHGDLRENAEYKSALEKRDRLQAEMKFLSDQIGKTEIITSQMVTIDEVGFGNIVQCTNSKGDRNLFVLLGPWDADPEKNILSIQSRFAQAMIGKKKGESFHFQEEDYTVIDIANYFEQK